MLKRILITGHSKGIGKALTEMCLSAGHHVSGISRTAIDNHPHLTQFSADLSTETGIKQSCKWLEQQKFDVVILNAGYNNIKPPEAYSINEVVEIINVNLTSHASIIKATINSLLLNKGMIIGVGSFSGTEVQKWNNFYGSAKAGFHHLLNNVFEQYRKQGLRVTAIIPDIADTSFYDHQDFEPSSNKETHIKATDVAAAIFNLIESQATYVTTQLFIRPQRFELNRKKK
ncbi:MAG: SDR family oxidoreductase [Bacteroidia bacterium]|jgi:short-subunit dehydrogenase|nr:SDR family oxidoreductase [Bacteroidia bacterium]